MSTVFDGVMTLASTRIRTNGGMDSTESTMRIMIASTTPPTYPAMAPHSVPTTVARIAAASPTIKVDWPLTISRPSTS